MTLPPTAYTPPPVSPLLTSLDPKHHPHHPSYVQDDCPNDSNFDDDIININITTADDSQPSILVGDQFFDDKPNRDFENATSSNFTSDLVANFTSSDAMSNTESTVGDDATDATESIVFDDKTDRNSNDDDDSEFYLYKGPSAPFMLRKFPRDIYNTTTMADEAKPATDDATSTTDHIILDKKPN